ncbi:MAG: hypothetical protein HRT89_06495 [Lentisphaeria bacterium]|nr:hypothetical protein [Lentisphaeria bacterium]NQZ67702.1 hypothetical protein [Lentisphaeria bacterium]
MHEGLSWFWFLNGDCNLTHLKDEIREFAESGATALVLHPRNGLPVGGSLSNIQNMRPEKLSGSFMMKGKSSFVFPQETFYGPALFHRKDRPKQVSI